MTDITRLINSIKRRTSSARELGYDVLFVKLEDLDALADSLEIALRTNTAQADHIEQVQDRFNKLAEENLALRDAITTHSQSIHFCEVCGKDDPCSNDDVCYVLDETPATDRIVAGIKADGVEMAIDHIAQTICPNHETVLKEFAAQLREGADK